MHFILFLEHSLTTRLLQGLPSNITLKNGEKYTGVLSGTSLDPTEMRYVFKMVKRVQPAGEAHTNGAGEASDEYIGVGDTHVMSFDIGDVADFHVNHVLLDNKSQSKVQNGMTNESCKSQLLTLWKGASSGFRTDTDISGNMAFRERDLQKWEPSAETDVDLSLETTSRSNEWDQFATNEQLFGVKTNYDENIYTTTINRSDPQYAARAARAEKIAREIEGSSASNSHMREERGQTGIDDKGGDEEEK
jgi:PAB1-binding protein PBP1